MGEDFSKTVKTIDYKTIGESIYLAEKKLGVLKEKKDEMASKIDKKMKDIQEHIDKLNNVLESTMLEDSTVEVKNDTYTKKVDGVVTFSLTKETPRFTILDEGTASKLFPKTTVNKKEMNSYLKKCDIDGDKVLDSKSKKEIDWIEVTKYRSLKKYWQGNYKKDKENGQQKS